MNYLAAVKRVFNKKKFERKAEGAALNIAFIGTRPTTCYPVLRGKRPGASLFIVLVVLPAIFMAGCNTLQSIEIYRAPDKTVYGQGQALDTAGIGVTAYYKKGNTDDVPPYGLRVSGYDQGSAGEQAVTVTMNGKWPSKPQSANFTVNVIPVERISVESLPDAQIFKQGEDFNPAGLLVKAEFQNGAVPAESIAPGRLKLSGYDKNKSGTQTITVDYYGKQTSFDVKVAAITKIAVKSPPYKTDYFTGENLDITGLVVYGTFEGFGEVPVPITRENVTGFDKYRSGEQQVMVLYQGKTASFPVTVTAMSAIRIDSPPIKVDYENGEDLDLAGLSVSGTRQGSSSIELVDTSRLQVSGYDKFKEGPQNVTVTVGGKSATFAVRVGPSPFVGVWGASFEFAGKMDTVTLEMSEDTWSITWVEPGGDGIRPSINKAGGTYTRDSGTHATLLNQTNNGWVTTPKEASIIQPNILKLSGGLFRSSFDGTLTRDYGRHERIGPPQAPPPEIGPRQATPPGKGQPPERGQGTGNR